MSTTIASNRLLARLPAATQRRLGLMLEPVRLVAGQVLHEPDSPIQRAWFPAGAVISLMASMRGGDAVEIAMVGAEGVVGHHVALGGRPARWRAVVQLGGAALGLPAAGLCTAAGGEGPLRDLLGDYDDAFVRQVARGSACHALHRLGPRCCSRLLATMDRTGSPVLRLTHAALSVLMGARRASVTEVLRPLHDAGIVETHRGRIIVVARPALEAHACECYSSGVSESARR